MRPSLPSSFAKICLIFCFALLAVSSAVGQTALGFTQAPDHVSASPAGCRNNGGISLPDGGGFFICHPDTPNTPSTDAYTGGDLGKNWAELDLVPFRLTTSRSSSSTTPTYNIIIAADYIQNNTKGYDFVSVPIIDPNEDGGTPSDGSCQVSDANAGDGQNGLETVTGVTGGTDQTIYRTLTITQGQNTTCYFAYYQRLAIGASGFSGSNLQAYIFTSADFKTGKQTIPISVKKCNSAGCVPSPAPQTINKTMTAKVPFTTMWGLSGTGPNSISGNTCDTTQLKQQVQFTIAWTATPSSLGGVNIVTSVFATNPGSTLVHATVTDYIYPGTDATMDNDPTGLIVPPGTNAALDVATGTPVTVPANSMNVLVLTHSYNDPSGVIGTGYNDIAVATYTDAAGNAVPGNVWGQASGTAVAGSPTNTTATINNQESITGTGLNFSTDSVTPSDVSVTGTFSGGYTLGTEIPLNFAQPLSWTSNSQDASTVETLGGAGVTFGKTVYLPLATLVSGTLTDSASLSESGGGTVNMTPLNVPISAAPVVSLQITKNLNVAFATDQTFTFVLTDSKNNTTPARVTVTAGQTQGTTTVGNLIPDKYTVTEDPSALWTNDGPKIIDLSPVSGQVTCTGSNVTFNNTLQEGHIIVKKVTVPASSQSFTFTPSYNGGTTFNLTDGGSNDSGLIAAGNYSVSETVPTGWDQTSATCDNGNDPSAITLAAGATVTCTFSNTQRGHIVVKKVTNPSGSTQQFTFTPSYESSFQLADGGSNDSGLLTPGSGYSVSETVPTGWDQTSATCDDGDSPSSITLAAGATVTCTFTNTQRAHIIVKKVTVPSGSTQQFTFTPSYNGGATFNLADGGSNDSGAQKPGSGYSVSETVPTGWDQTGATCDNGNAVTNITLSPGQTVTCTFTNTQRAHLVVKKVTVPSGDTQSFSFASSGPNSFSQSFALTDGGSHDSGAVAPGSGYSASETVPSGWDQTSATCDNGNAVSNITLNAGQTVTCTFTNTKRARLIVKKVTVPSGDTQSFSFASSGPNSFSQSFALTDGQSHDSGVVAPGSGYSASETVPSGWDQTSATCDNGNAVTNITLSPGQTVTCTFTNTKRAHLVVKKVTVPSGDTQSFSFASSGPNSFSQSFALTDGGSHDSGAVAPGSGYAASETVPSGWDQTSTTCDNGNAVGSITLNAGQTVTCTFTNTKRAHIIVKKVTVPATDTTTLFSFTPSYGSSFQLKNGGSNDSGALLPGGGYSVSETPTTGWDLTSATCDNGNSPSAITLGAGKTVTCTFTNTQRASLTVVKKTINGDGTFNFTTTGTGLSAFSLTTSNGTASKNFSLAPGGYSVKETTQTGWSLTSSSCSNGNSPSAITLAAGQSVTCTFTNTRAAAKTGALTMGFWQNKNGQAIITGGASTGGICNSGTWLRQYAPFQDLSATANCSAVASYVFNIIKAANASGSSMNAMLKAQMLATALDVFFSDPALGGNKIGAPAAVGGVLIDLTKICNMSDNSNGTGTCSGSYSNASSAFGGATSLTVSQILAYAASQSNAGGSLWYGNVKSTQQLAKNTFDAINNQAAFAP